MIFWKMCNIICFCHDDDISIIVGSRHRFHGIFIGYFLADFITPFENTLMPSYISTIYTFLKFCKKKYFTHNVGFPHEVLHLLLGQLLAQHCRHLGEESIAS